MAGGRKNIQVTSESESGRNLGFTDPGTVRSMTRAEFVQKIDDGQYTGYHVRKVNGLDTPVSNPDRSKSDNLD